MVSVYTIAKLLSNDTVVSTWCVEKAICRRCGFQERQLALVGNVGSLIDWPVRSGIGCPQVQPDPHWTGWKGKATQTPCWCLPAIFQFLAKRNQCRRLAKCHQPMWPTTHWTQTQGPLTIMHKYTHTDTYTEFTICKERCNPARWCERKSLCYAGQDQGLAWQDSFSHTVGPMRGQASDHVTVWPPERQLPSCIDS